MKKRIFLTVLFLCIVFSVPSANASLCDFFNITNNGNEDLTGQLCVDVTAQGSSQVLFTFYNDVGIPSSITDIYFDDNLGMLSDIANIVNSAGVSFSEGADPINLPGGHDYDFKADFSADSNPPIVKKGVNSSSESVSLLFDLAAGHSYDDVMNAIMDDSLKIGLHIQSIGVIGGSDSYINLMPLPGAILLGLLGLGTARMKLRRSL